MGTPNARREPCEPSAGDLGRLTVRAFFQGLGCWLDPSQTLGRLRLDPCRPNRDSGPLCHGAIPRQNERGIVTSHLVSARQPIPQCP